MFELIVLILVILFIWHLTYPTPKKATLEETRAFKKEVEELLAGIEEDEKRPMSEEEQKKEGETQGC